MGKSLDDVCNTNLNTPYEEKIRKWINYIGIDNIKPYIPFTMETIGKALDTDKNLNSLSIKEWERATGISVVKNTPPVFIGNGLYRELVKKGITLMSQSELVSILKASAIMIYKRYERGGIDPILKKYAKEAGIEITEDMTLSELQKAAKGNFAQSYNEYKKEEERKLQEEKQVEQQKQDMINGGKVVLTIVTASMIIPENEKHEDKVFDNIEDAIEYIGKLKTGFEDFDEKIPKFDTEYTDMECSIRINTLNKSDKGIIGYEDYSIKTMDGKHIPLTWEMIEDYINNLEKEENEMEL